MRYTWNTDESRTERVVVAYPQYIYGIRFVARMIGNELFVYLDCGTVFGKYEDTIDSLTKSARFIKRKLPKIKKGLKAALKSKESEGTFDVGLAGVRWG